MMKKIWQMIFLKAQMGKDDNSNRKRESKVVNSSLESQMTWKLSQNHLSHRSPLKISCKGWTIFFSHPNLTPHFTSCRPDVLLSAPLRRNKKSQRKFSHFLDFFPSNFRIWGNYHYQTNCRNFRQIKGGRSKRVFKNG